MPSILSISDHDTTLQYKGARNILTSPTMNTNTHSDVPVPTLNQMDGLTITEPSKKTNTQEPI